MLSYISQHYITVPCLKDVFLCGNKYTFFLFYFNPQICTFAKGPKILWVHKFFDLLFADLFCDRPPLALK